MKPASGKIVDKDLIKTIYKKRDPFTHKGDYGHACLIAGSIGLMGAAVLATKACLRSGAGKVTAHTAGIGYNILQTAAPEAMTKISGDTFISSADDISKYDSLGIGPGIGLYASHQELLKTTFTDFKKPIVIDADALNILSDHKELLDIIPANSILTPHQVEFERLFGKSENPEQQNRLALKMSQRYKIFIVLKGHHTLIASPDNDNYFNSTGNAGMATGGSGDVLTGILTGLLAQGYSPLQTCLLGVYLHGLAGDIVAKNLSEEAMIAGDIINFLGEAYKQIQ
jgi:hydroxyethylthiazole kinase-like uncharacterized protein yjeF